MDWTRKVNPVTLTNAFGFTNSYVLTNTSYPYNAYTLLCTNVGIKWIYTTNSSLFEYSTPAIGADGTVYINGSYGPLFALNSTNGNLKWQTASFRCFNHSTAPIIGKNGTIFGGIAGYFYAVDPTTTVTNGIMNYKWIYTNNNNTYPCFSLTPSISADGTVYAELYGYGLSINDQLLAFNPNTGIPNWTNNLGTTSYYGYNWKSGSLAVASDGEIYLADVDGKIYSFSPNGTTNWTYQTGSQALNSPLIGPDGTIYVGSVDGDHDACNVYAFAGASPIACSAWPEDGRNARRTSAVASAQVSLPLMTTNGFQLTITGTNNMPVCVFATSDFMYWTNVGQTILTGGSTNFVDIGSSNYPYGFYRAMPQ
jgi:outer membrane protein assembly factor BamB